ncbi:hypothetical protein PPYR_07379 [Photinus pyralis]|uniref:Sm domain-containing protein n=2 Tax=Photinus pyralis TaxID=7054 RepID=A0A1Y1LNP4_PHOPY|nr:N-alpha-acetyltransferase 38, NatC auxiliary subunit [Photinus pyralis]KAB0799499.1 hypothetical protein PPYR_07379 [Photinus pyralis]
MGEIEEPLLSTSKLECLEQEDDVNEPEVAEDNRKPLNMSPGAVQLRKWLNKTLKIEMSDGRVLIGVFLCTDRDANIILGSCSEYLPEDTILERWSSDVSNGDEARMLGLVMVPGKHIVNICMDEIDQSSMERPLSSDLDTEGIM